MEENLQISIPPYIKNVLTYFGYDNFHTISTIEENDLEYIATEVRKGGIMNYFTNKSGIEDPLYGSSKSEQNFEFSRGHQKLLMVIAKLLKKKLNENGVDAFLVKPSTKKEKNQDAAIEDVKETKDLSVSTLEFTKYDSKAFVYENIINLQAELLKHAVQSLFIHSSVMYEEVSTYILLKLQNLINSLPKMSGSRILK